MVEVDISCLPKDLPTYIEVDLIELAIGDSIHLSEIKVPEGVELANLSEDNDPIITSVSRPKVVVEEVVADPESEESEEGEEGEEGKEGDSSSKDGENSDESNKDSKE